MPGTCSVSSTSRYFPGSRPTVSRPMSVVRARRPIATSTSSPRSSPSSVVSTTSPPSRRAAVTPVPSRTSTPRLAQGRRHRLAGGRFQRGQQPLTVLDDRDLRTRARATPWPARSRRTPPPTISSRPGTSFALVASRGVQGSTSREPVDRRDGGRRAGAHRHRVPGREPGLGAVGVGDHDRPLAVEPAGAAEQVDAGSVHPLDLEESSQCEVNPSRRASVAATSWSPVTACAAPSTARASLSTSVPRSSALLGMHAQ